MSKLLGVAIAGLTAFGCSAGALAAQQNMRIRGTIESVNGNTVAIKSYRGNTVDLMLSSRTKVAAVLPSSFSDIRPGDFIGAGATGPENDLKALEVVIFPESMRGTGKGHYAWSVPAAVANADTHAGGQASTGAPPVQGTMTNGTVAGAAPPGGAPPVQGTMTNGTVAGSNATNRAPPIQGTMTNGTVASNTSKAGGKKLTVSYGNGKKVQIVVPPDAAVVRFAPAQPSVLVPGAKAFAVASKPSGSNELIANFVAVGKNGLTPPM